MSQNELMLFSGPRTPTEVEWGSVTELMYSIFFKQRGYANYEDGARTWPMSLRHDAREDTFAMFYDGQPVSAIERLERDVIIHGCQLRIGFVGSVCTHPDYRNRGLASTILAATMKRFHENGVDFVCISGNRPMYQRAGARQVGGMIEFKLSKLNAIQVSQTACGAIALRIATMDDAQLLAQLNNREPLRFIRPLSDYELVLKYGHCVGRPCEFIIAMSNTSPMGYLLITKVLEHNGRKFRRIFEYAGERQIVMEAIFKVASELPHDVELHIDVERGDALEKLLMQADIHSEPIAKPGTICVLDFPRTMTKLKPFFSSILPHHVVDSLRFAAGRERYVAWCDDGMLEIQGETNMVWTLLGAPPDGSISDVRASGAMRELVDACLPIPLPHLQMNMI